MKKFVYLVTGVALSFAVMGGSFDLLAAEKEKKKKNVDTYRLLNLFGDVFERVRSSYVTETSDQDLIEAAITGMQDLFRSAGS